MNEHTSSQESEAESIKIMLKELESKLSTLRETDPRAYLTLVQEVTLLLKEVHEIA